MSWERGSVPDEDRIVVTGMGIVSPLGHDVEGAMDALFAGQSGIDHLPAEISEQYPHLDVHVAATVRNFEPGTDSVLHGMVKAKEWPRIHRGAQFGLWAGSRALLQAGLIDADAPQLSADSPIDPFRVGVVLGTGVGGADRVGDARLRMEPEVGEAGELPFPADIFNVLPERNGTVLSMATGARGPLRTVSSACATGNTAIATAADLLRAGRADVVITGGTEAQVTGTSLGLFRVIGALDNSKDSAQASRPFDRDARGFVMGEGGAALTLETLAHARRRGAVPLAELVGYAETGDAFHNTNPLGAGDTLRLALAELGLAPSDTVRAYINAHGTSTQVGDVKELVGIRQGLEMTPRDIDVVGISSSKSAIGHTLGAAGALEAVVSIVALHRDTVPPSLKLDDPIDEARRWPMSPHTETPVPEGIDIAINQSFGFGGPNAISVFGKVAS